MPKPYSAHQVAKLRPACFCSFLEGLQYHKQERYEGKGFLFRAKGTASHGASQTGRQSLTGKRPEASGVICNRAVHTLLPAKSTWLPVLEAIFQIAFWPAQHNVCVTALLGRTIEKAVTQRHRFVSSFSSLLNTMWHLSDDMCLKGSKT